MHNSAPLPAHLQTSLTAAIRDRGIRKVARDLGVHHATLSRAAAGAPISEQSQVSLSRIAPRTRVRAEFQDAQLRAYTPPPMKLGAYSWTLEEIRRARDEQFRGYFYFSSLLAEAMRADDAAFNARMNRLAPQNAVQTRLKPADGARGAACVNKANASVFIAPSVMAGIHGTLVDHGVAIGYINKEVNATGTRTDFRLEEWPIEWVKWHPGDRVLWTVTRECPRVDIHHGDGTWVVFRKFAWKPWIQDACILPMSFVYAAHMNGISDWAMATRMHGLTHLIGELPEGVSLVDRDGNPEPEAAAFLRMLTDVTNGETAAAIRPAGSKTDFTASASTQWQIFGDFAGNREKAAARIYLGTDASLGSAGGAPGVDISELFGVASTKVQGDFSALEQGLNTGVYQPWAAINEGSSRYAPSFEYMLPDPDQAKQREQRAQNFKQFTDTIAALRSNGYRVTQELSDRVAHDLGVDPAPQLQMATP